MQMPAVPIRPLLFTVYLAAMMAPPTSAQQFHIPEGDLPISGGECAELASFDRLMRQFLAEHHVPGAALAVAKDGRLVYARGFGYADLAEKTPVEPTALFRVASVSKPITAVAVMQLVEQGRLRLDSPAFELLGYDVSRNGRDPRLGRITVRHLLQHTAGWDRDQSGDPMTSPDIRRAAMQRFMLEYPFDPEYMVRHWVDQPLDFDPGARYAYSNLGYCLLGRIIEKLTGQAYAAYVQDHVLAPVGIRDMRIGRATTRAQGEVHYYAPNGDGFDSALDNPVELYESHGGWIASAVDLVRFGVEFGSAAPVRKERCLLDSQTLAELFRRPQGRAGFNEDGSPAERYYGLGWNVRPVGESRSIWHAGRIPGTASLLVCRHDGVTWAVVFNTHANREGKFLNELIDPVLHAAADGVVSWPEALGTQERRSPE